MRIDPSRIAPIDPMPSSQISGTSSVRSASSAHPEDKVSLSQAARLTAEAMAQPEVRMDKVEAIRSQIALGTYKVDPQKIAAAMIASLLNGTR